MRISLLLLFVTFKMSLVSQELIASDSLTLNSKIVSICGNVRSEVFVGLENGEVVKISSSGSILEVFSYPNLGSISKINCANPLKVFVFFEDSQQYLFLERFSVRPSVYTTETELFARTDFLELAADQSLWSISSPSLALRQYTYGVSNEIYLLQSILKENEDILGLHSVGNEMILQTQEQLHQFNLAGQLMNSSTGTSSRISISQNEAYYVTTDGFQLNSLNSDYSQILENLFEMGIKIDSTVVASKKNQLFFYSIR